MATCIYLGHVVGGVSLRPEQMTVEVKFSYCHEMTELISNSLGCWIFES